MYRIIKLTHVLDIYISIYIRVDIKLRLIKLIDQEPSRGEVCAFYATTHLFHVINSPMLEIIPRYQFALSIESISLLFLPFPTSFLSLSLSSSTRFHPAEYTCQSSKCISAKRRPLLKVKKKKKNKSTTSE